MIAAKRHCGGCVRCSEPIPLFREGDRRAESSVAMRTSHSRLVTEDRPSALGHKRAA
jgi:hypothetical protein